MAVAKKWITLDRLRTHYGFNGATFDNDETEPPHGPFYGLNDAVSLLEDGDKWDQLAEAGKNHCPQLGAGEIEAELQKELEAPGGE